VAIMLLKRKILVLIVGILLISTGCMNQYADETARVEEMAKEINEDLLLIEEAILKGGLSFEHLDQMTLTNEQIYKMNQQYERNTYGLFHNEDAIHSTGVLTGYKIVDFPLKKRLYKTQMLENVLIHAYNNFPLIDQAYYLEGNGLLRVFPSVRATDNISPKTNFFDIRIFEEVKSKTEEKFKWFLVPYLNPSGRNWVISLFNPIYAEDELQGVLGYDIVASNFENFYMEKDMLLLSHSGDIISVDSSLNQLLNIRERDHDIYYEELMTGKLADKSYNLKNSKIRALRVMFSKVTQGETNFSMVLNEEYFVISKPVKTINSYLVKITEIK